MTDYEGPKYKGRNWYQSVSGLQRYRRCGELYRIRMQPNVRPEYQWAATVIGKAVHRAIAQLHKNPSLDIPSLVEQIIGAEESINDAAPVRWGDKQFSREGRTETAVRIVSGYWHHNSGLDVRKSESWFWFDIPVDGDEPIRMRGRFDQIVAVDGRLGIHELKTSASAPNMIELQRNIQLAVEFYALKHGYIALDDDLPYVASHHDNAHIHVWKETDEPGIYQCEFCSIKTQHINKYPDFIQYVDLNAYDPGKRNFAEGILEPKRPQPPPMVVDESGVDKLLDIITHTALSIRESERTGVWSPAILSGFSSPCSDCPYNNHCEYIISKPI